MVHLGSSVFSFQCCMLKSLMTWEILHTNDLFVMKPICHSNNLNFILADDTLFRKDVRDHDHSNNSPSTEVYQFQINLLNLSVNWICFYSDWLYCGHWQTNNPWGAWGKTKAGEEENQLSFVSTEKRNRTTTLLISATIYPQHN